jgi:hypothetical protein
MGNSEPCSSEETAHFSCHLLGDKTRLGIRAETIHEWPMDQRTLSSMGAGTLNRSLVLVVRKPVVFQLDAGDESTGSRTGFFAPAREDVTPTLRVCALGGSRRHTTHYHAQLGRRHTRQRPRAHIGGPSRGANAPSGSFTHGCKVTVPHCDFARRITALEVGPTTAMETIRSANTIQPRVS